MDKSQLSKRDICTKLITPAVKAAGFQALEMAATLAGEPFYARCGYSVERRWQDENGAVPVPLLTMAKRLS